MSRKIIDFDVERAIKLFKDGRSIIEIAKKMEVKSSYARVKLKEKLGDEYVSIGQEKEKQRCLEIIKVMLGNCENKIEIIKATGKSRLVVLEYISEIESEIVIKPKIELKEKEYEKRNITYSGWGYQMCETWGF